MTRGLLASLSTPEEIALRRIAHGSMIVDSKAASQLLALALIERTSNGLRLTPLGRLRFDALPKAPLLTPQRSIHAMTGYVEGLIDKAQAPRGIALGRVPASAPACVDTHCGEPLPQAEGEEPHLVERPIYRPIYLFVDGDWKSRAERALTRTRRAIMEHRQRQVRLCDASDRRIASSRLLLQGSAPIRPAWLNAAK